MPLWVFREVPGGDVLPVAGDIGERDRLVVEQVQKPGRAAAVLDVGLALRIPAVIRPITSPTSLPQSAAAEHSPIARLTSGRRRYWLIYRALLGSRPTT
jgi:hypothetical protein